MVRLADMSREFVLCDVFAEVPFAGNQLAVFLNGDGLGDDAMIALAREFGWSEVTFVQTSGRNQPPRVRIWTPGGELPFAGHPTVGTAVVLALAGRIQAGWSLLELGVGQVPVEVTIHGNEAGEAAMTQSAPAFGPQYAARERLAHALGLVEEDLAPELPAQIVSTGLAHLMVPVRSLEALGRARPSSDLIGDVVREAGSQCAYLFTVDTPESTAAARARLLSGWMREDPATGSAAGPLGAYLVHYGLHRSGLLEIEQGVEMGRPSRIRVEVPVDAGEIGPVRVSGSVRVWARGEVNGV